MRRALHFLATALAAVVVEGGISLACEVDSTFVDLIHNEAYPARSDGTKFSNTCAGSSHSETFRITNDGSSSVTIGAAGSSISWYDTTDTRTVSDVLNYDMSGDITIAAGATANLVITVNGDSSSNNWAWVNLTDSSSNALFNFGMTAKVVIPEVSCERRDTAPRPLSSSYPLSFGQIDAGDFTSQSMEFGCKLIQDCSVVVTDISMTTSTRSSFTATVEDSSYTGLVVDGWTSAVTYTFDPINPPVSYYEVDFNPSQDGIYDGEVTVAVTGGFDYKFPVEAAVGEPTNAPTGSPTPSTFDWGDDCNSGSGSFSASLPVAKGFVQVGTDDIPIGKFDLVIELNATNDLDIWLYDATDTSLNDGKGKPLVRWCNARQLSQDSSNDCTDDNSCVCANSYGFLGQSEDDVESMSYETEFGTMNITYSGYDGGNEYICISGGMTKVPLKMYAYAYEVGTVDVDYKWAASCEGDPFLASLREGELTEIGDVSNVGVVDLTIGMTPVCGSGTSDAECRGQDLDIQLYDTTQFHGSGTEPDAIVAWCTPQATCNYGAFTASTETEGTWDSALPIVYSGWNGIDGYLGREYISIPGVAVDRTLKIKALGYSTGMANTRYWWTDSVIVTACPAYV